MSRFNPRVGDGVTIIGAFGNQAACTVIERRTRELTIQRDHAELLNSPESDHPDAIKLVGGLVSNFQAEQLYTYEPNPNGLTAIFTLRPNGRWVLRGESNRHGPHLIPGREERFDLNFPGDRA